MAGLAGCSLNLAMWSWQVPSLVCCSAAVSRTPTCMPVPFLTRPLGSSTLSSCSPLFLESQAPTCNGQWCSRQFRLQDIRTTSFIHANSQSKVSPELRVLMPGKRKAAFQIWHLLDSHLLCLVFLWLESVCSDPHWLAFCRPRRPDVFCDGFLALFQGV